MADLVHGLVHGQDARYRDAFQQTVPTEKWPIYNVKKGLGGDRHPEGGLYGIKFKLWEENLHEPETMGHVWRYLKGEWFDSARRCQGCNRFEFHFRCLTLGHWVASFEDLPDKSIIEKARLQVPGYWEAFGHLKSNPRQECPKKEVKHG